MSKVRRALISVTDKTGVAEFAKGLQELGIEILSTGGTGKALAEAGVAFREVSDATGFPEIMGGRVKTLHPAIHGGILFRRGLEEDEKAVEAHGLVPIDLVVVNLYQFEKRTSGNVSDAEAIEAIDIGGPGMIRAAAKNWAYVGVVTAHEQYNEVLAALKADGELSDGLRRKLAGAAFEMTASYDRAISDWFAKTAEKEEVVMPARLNFVLSRQQDMRYGENPHQAAAYYGLKGEEGNGLRACKQFHGKELSFNNMIDADIALALPSEFEEPCVAILKHTTPSGVAIGATIAEAEAGARACDPMSAYGGIVGMNRICDAQTAKQINKAFTEVVVAPGFTEEALALLMKKKNLRILEASPEATKMAGYDVRRVAGGLLVQERDYGFPEIDELTVVTKRQPTEEEFISLRFAWKVCKYVKSNAVLFATAGKTMGIGAGQMSRVDAVRLARLKAEDACLSLANTVLASDAYFPFADGMMQAVEAGATAVIQPGGSIRDQEVIDAADENNVAMVFTGRRHFRHA